MAFHWRFRDLPELQHLSGDERRLVIRRAVPRDQIVWMWARCAGLGVVIGGIMGTWTGSLGQTPLTGLAIAALTMVIATAAFFQIYMLIIRVQLRNTLMHELRGERLPVCLRCGYDLKGSRARRCPECGARVVPPKRDADATSAGDG